MDNWEIPLMETVRIYPLPNLSSSVQRRLYLAQQEAAPRLDGVPGPPSGRSTAAQALAPSGRPPTRH